MPQGLTYLSLKCVLEHLEANRRIHLASRCPALQKTEISTPLHLDSLEIGDSWFILNNFLFQLSSTDNNGKAVPYVVDQSGERDESADGIALPGDIMAESQTLTTDNVNRLVESSRNSNKSIQITFEYLGSEKFYTRPIPNNIQFHVALKKLSCFLLGERQLIYVNRLKMRLVSQKVLRLPLGLKLRVNHIDQKVDYFFIINSLIDESRGSLKTHQLHLNKQMKFELWKKAEKIIVIQHDSSTIVFNWPPLFARYKQFYLKSSNLTTTDVLRIVKNLKENRGEIGVCYTFEFRDILDIINFLYDIKKEFNATVVKLKKPDERAHKVLQCLSIPMDSTSELCIYKREDPSDGSLQLKLEILPIGSTTPL